MQTSRFADVYPRKLRENVAFRRPQAYAYSYILSAQV